MMLDSLRMLDILIGNCNFRLYQAENNCDDVSWSHWFKERERLYLERASLLDIKLGGV